MQIKKILLRFSIHLFLFSLFFVLYGCTVTDYPEKLVKNRIQHTSNSYIVIKGTLSILLYDQFDRKRASQLFKLDSKFFANIIFVDEKTKKIFVFDYFKSNKKALKDLFNKVKQTGFYNNKKHIEPVFRVTLQGVKMPLTKWGLNSGWRRITKDPYQPYGFILKKVIKLDVTKKRIPHNCYIKGMPCM